MISRNFKPVLHQDETLLESHQMNVVIVDKRGSALWIAANNRANFDRYTVLAALDYTQPRHLIRAILALNPKYIVFAWRGCLKDIANDYSSTRMLRSLDQEILIGVTIPDHVDDAAANVRFHPLLFADYFLVSSRILFEIYQVSPYSSRLSGILHDVPDYRYIEDLSLISPQNTSNKIIVWVGNSEWGKNQGFRDHKGLRNVMEPAYDLIRNHDSDFQLIIIDSSIDRLENYRVLEIIQSADFLIQTSFSEGTGLPLIEAAGLGTLVITTNVGVAPEILVGGLQKLICARDPELIANRVISEYPFRVQTQALLQKAYMNYLDLCREESIVPRETPVAVGLWRTHKGYRLWSIKWLLRFLRTSY
jgi:glycosyltransferase involved in cell wall biosynthesis